MKINELRIGNYLQHGKKYVIVDDIDRGCVGAYYGEEYHKHARSAFSPIKITGDILINIGFKKGYNEIYSKTIKDGFYECNVSYQNVKDNKYSFVAYGYKNGELKRQIRLDNIQYLHELQNVFFSFTNQELEIKL